MEKAPQKKYSVVTSVPMASDSAGVALLKKRLLDAAQEYNYFYSDQEGDLEAHLDMTYDQAQNQVYHNNLSSVFHQHNHIPLIIPSDGTREHSWPKNQCQLLDDAVALSHIL